MIREAVVLAGASFAVYLGMTCRSVIIIVTQWMDFTFQWLGQTNTCSKMPWEKERERERKKKTTQCTMVLSWYCLFSAKILKTFINIWVSFTFNFSTSQSLPAFCGFGENFGPQRNKLSFENLGPPPPKKKITWPNDLPKSDAVLETNHGLSSWKISISFEWSAENFPRHWRQWETSCFAGPSFELPSKPPKNTWRPAKSKSRFFFVADVTSVMEIPMARVEHV